LKCSLGSVVVLLELSQGPIWKRLAGNFGRPARARTCTGSSPIFPSERRAGRTYTENGSNPRDQSVPLVGPPGFAWELQRIHSLCSKPF